MIVTNKWQQTGTAAITESAPGRSGQRLVLTSVNIINDTACNVLVQSPSGSTVWQTQMPAGGLNHTWTQETGPRGAENQAMVISVSAGTSYKISVTGVTVE